MKRQALTFKIAHIITKHILKKSDSYQATFGIVLKELAKSFNPLKLLKQIANKLTKLKQTYLKIFAQKDLFDKSNVVYISYPHSYKQYRNPFKEASLLKAIC